MQSTLAFQTTRKFLAAACVAGAALTGAGHSYAADVWVRVGPPAPRVEVVPPHRRGYTWAPGHWEWRHGRYTWQAGTWMRERPGYVYTQPMWVERNGRWYRQGGAWARHDRDGDGVPNAVDRRPNDPNRR